MAGFNFAPYQAASKCVGREMPGARALDTFQEEQFPETWFGNIYSCRDIVGGDDPSHHAEGRAGDRMVPQGRPSSGVSVGYQMVKLLAPHGRALGIDHIITNLAPWQSGRGRPMIFTAYYPEGRVYTGLHPHKDHNHTGQTRAAALGLTLETIRAIVLPEPEPQPPEVGDVMLPFIKGDRSEDIRLFKDRMNETFEGTTGLGGVSYKKLDIAHKEHGDLFEDATQNRVRDFLGEGFTGHPSGKEGLWVGGQQWNALELLWIKRKLHL